MREHITSGDTAFRKAYLGTLVDRIEVDDQELRIKGRKDVLEQTVIANAAGRDVVRSFVPKWLSFLNTYRNLCIAPTAELRVLLEQMRQGYVKLGNEIT